MRAFSNNTARTWIAAGAAIASMLALLAFGASPAGANGCIDPAAGTAEDPYLINNAGNLRCLQNNSSYWDAHKHFRQTADIDLTGETWTPIGTTPAFNGEYDGDNHLISGMTINDSSVGSSGFVGLFGYTEGGAIIKNLRVDGTVNVTGGYWVGGVVGVADLHTEIINVHSSVDVTSGTGVGGLVGFLPESTVSRSSATGAVTGTGASVGGLVGDARGNYPDQGRPAAEIIDSYATGPVTGAVGYAGIAGLLGSAQSGLPGVNVTRSYSTGLVTGGTGERQTCSDPYPYCTEYGTAGGLIADSYFADPPVANPNLSVTGSFWDTQTSGQSASADGKATGATTSQMKSLSTFSAASWDISDGWSPTSTWGICDGQGYPFLNAQFTASPCSAPEPTRYSLTVSRAGGGSGSITSSPAGIDCGSTCTADFDGGTAVTLTASPAVGSSFEGWSGAGCSGTGPCEVTMSETRSVQATFTAPSNSFTIPATRAVGSTAVTRIRVPGPGTITQRGTYGSGQGRSSATKTACRTSRNATAAGTYTLICRLNRSARNARTSGPLRVRLRTTFTPTGGSPRSELRRVTFSSLKPSFTG